jgi:hypothetical protein
MFVPAIALISLSSSFAAPAFDTAKIESITGLSGKLNEKEKTFKLSKPRTDVKVSVDGRTLPPFQGLGSWIGFTKGRKKDLMAMGDLVLFEDEVNPVMDTLFASGIDVTALHNHFFYDEPRVLFMHINGEGTLEKLSQGIRAAFDKVAAIREDHRNPAKSFGLPSIPDKNAITGAPVETILGSPGEAKDGMFKVTIGRKARMSCGCDAGKDMGINTWAAFSGSDERAVVDGDFAAKEAELQPVLRALRKGNINIVAIHSHMTGENPRYLFLHYWGVGPAQELAKTLRAALGEQK